MRMIDYKGAKIKSTPFQSPEDNKYSVNGVIELHYGAGVIDLLIQKLNIPDSEWIHETEDNADEIFIKYAKVYIDSIIQDQNST